MTSMARGPLGANGCRMEGQEGPSQWCARWDGDMGIGILASLGIMVS